MATIVETLAERVYAHGHAIGFKDAKEIGLPAQAATTQEDGAMWDLLNEYESDMKNLESDRPRSYSEFGSREARLRKPSWRAAPAESRVGVEAAPTEAELLGLDGRPHLRGLL
jgi:hypothetical protein